MTSYPLDFYRRAEEKWKRRIGSWRSKMGPSTNKKDTPLAPWPWLLAIGQGLKSEYTAAEQPLPKRLVALLKELTLSARR
jgi:hypothetical protein